MCDSRELVGYASWHNSTAIPHWWSHAHTRSSASRGREWGLLCVCVGIDHAGIAASFLCGALRSLTHEHFIVHAQMTIHHVLACHAEQLLAILPPLSLSHRPSPHSTLAAMEVVQKLTVAMTTVACPISAIRPPSQERRECRAGGVPASECHLRDRTISWFFLKSELSLA